MVLAAVYAVPDEHVGDQVMAALEISPDADPFDPQAFEAFLSAQLDLGTKWAPKYLRLTHDLPKTATSKVIKKGLRAERWKTTDPVWWRRGSSSTYTLLTPEDAHALDEAVADRVL